MKGLIGFAHKRLLFFALAGLILCAALMPDPGDGVSLGGPVLHALAFAALAVFASVLWPRGSPIVLVAGLVVFGASIELLQGWMALGREADWSDWFADVNATIATVMLVFLARAALCAWRDRSAYAETRLT